MHLCQGHHDVPQERQEEGGVMSEELKPCPFCGGEAKEGPVNINGTDSSDIGWVGCQECRVFMNYMNGERGRKLAIEAWNTRAERTCVMNKIYMYDEECVDGIECSECDWSDVHDHDEPMPERCPKCLAKVVM